MKKKKVLIIKLGYSETLNPEISRTCSLGDVLRTTVILNYLKGHHVSWLVDEKALPLLENNPYVNRILLWNLETSIQLRHETFDWVINLEKTPGVCALVEDITAWSHSGFRFDHETGAALSYNDAERVLSIAQSNDIKRENNKYWQEHLAHLIRRHWKPEHKYILAKRKVGERYDLGFNHKVGNKWENKTWPLSNWHTLGHKCDVHNLKTSWQVGFSNLHEYMDWISSCKCIVTCDSLGLHIALALGKKVIGIFGPSAWKEVYLYGQGVIITPPDSYKCAPCFLPECSHEAPNCMEAITVETVLEKIWEMLSA